jgi:glycerol-3-phosphate O-acyltransferase
MTTQDSQQLQRSKQETDLTKENSAIRYDSLSVVEGPLFHFDDSRLKILADVVSKTTGTISSAQLDLLIGEALYSERFRLKRQKNNLFTKTRAKADKALWNQVQSGLLQSPVEVDRKALLRTIVKHYAEEIGGHFNPQVYGFATRAVPWGMSWLLNAASVQRFLPWGMTEALASRIELVGEISTLQKLAKRGTILLVPTHQSNMDSVLIGYLIYLMSLPPFSYGAGLNLYSNPILSFFMSRLGAYTVDRKKTNIIYKETLKNYSTKILREGLHSIFFPGGGRSRSGALESKLKLGLLGTSLDAQLQNLQAGVENPSVFVVPMVVSYHFVLEASSLIEDYLAEAGKHRYIISDDEFWQPRKVLAFFWKLFSSQNGIAVRIGKPMDVFGNFVDDEGRSMGPNGTTIDPARWLTTRGELRSDAQRDQEYTRELGSRIVERFHRENTVLTSHLVAFAFFETLRRKYPDLDLYRFLRLSLAQRSMLYPEFLISAEAYHRQVVAAADRGELYLSQGLKTSDVRSWVEDGIRQLGLLHDAAVVKHRDQAIWTEDMNLLYYYRNRLSGYEFSLLSGMGGMSAKPGKIDPKGFLA